MIRESLFLIVCGVLTVTNGFPDGGPADTCVKPERFNQPNHGQARSQPLNTLPYEIVATTDTYQPGQQIQGIFYINSDKILTQHTNVP